MTFYRFAVLGMVMYGAMAKVIIVWSMADLFMGMVAILNLIVILVLGKVAFKALDDYSSQHEKGLNPVFKASTIPCLKGAECWEDEEKL